MRNIALTRKEQDAQVNGKIKLPLRDQYPKTVEITDGDKVIKTYRIVKTKNDKFMFQD